MKPIYEIEVTKENVPSILSKALIELLTTYGPRVRECIDSFVLPPSAFLAFREWGREYARIQCELNPRGMSFEGIAVTCGYLPFLTFAFKPDGWHYAHAEAKKFTAEFGATDA